MMINREHSGLLFLQVDLEVDTTKVEVLTIIVDIIFLELYFVFVEVTMNKIGYYELLDWDNLVLCIKF